MWFMILMIYKCDPPLHLWDKSYLNVIYGHFLCGVGFSLQVFYWGFLHLCSSKIHANSFLFVLCLCFVWYQSDISSEFHPVHYFVIIWNVLVFFFNCSVEFNNKLSKPVVFLDWKTFNYCFVYCLLWICLDFSVS